MQSLVSSGPWLDGHSRAGGCGRVWTSCSDVSLEDGRCFQKEKERLLVSEFLLLKVSEGQRRERQKQSQKERGIQQGHRRCAVFRTAIRVVLKGLDIGF